MIQPGPAVGGSESLAWLKKYSALLAELRQSFLSRAAFLFNPKLTDVLPDPVVKELAPGQAADFDLTFKEGALPAPGNYEGVLVAMGAGGEPARRKLILQIKAETTTPAPPASSSADKPAAPPRIALMPERIKTLNVAGTNFLPSLISHLTPALFFIGVTLLLLWFVLKRIREKVSGWPIRVFREVSALLLMVWAVLFLLELGKIIKPPCLSSVVAESVPMLPHTGTSTLGVVASDGGLGNLMRENDQLVVKGIKQSGRYEGSMVYAPEKPEKEMNVVVSVADWWPYAIITIGLGVLLGYAVVNYYKLRRGIDEQYVRAAKLWKEIIAGESYYQLDRYSRPYAGARMVELAQEWISTVQGDLRANNTATAKERLDRLEAYANSFARLRVDVDELFNIEQELKGRINKQDFHLGGAM